MNQIGEVIDTEQSKCREMNLEELMYVLKSQINLFWSWGCNNFKIDSKSRMRMFRMNVQGNHHRGHVYIFLNGSDLFDVYLTTNRGTIKARTGEIGVYVDQLVNWIDRYVERIPAYTD